ncbi:hypothetical protein [Gynuella sunshinyii]|uniref:Uncharacterized protein n=1 Tax=Gynuella sunshinyii YC6258 TaxID=1445510 RepID=A0A0C5VCV9_9GAMM|nr:hypothetical protein [Gynuella sunshinyii]AJQ92096.1 hypothetical Protein YC6258_00040 [Gynuella sunshinyii YC6258]
MNKQIMILMAILPAITCMAEDNHLCQAEIDQLLWVNNADARQDAMNALAAGKLNYKAVYGISVILPGIANNDYARSMEEEHYDIIPGTSDALCNEEHGRLNELAYQYARTYNRTLQENDRQKTSGQP